MGRVALPVEMQRGARVLVGVVRVDLHEVAEHVVRKEPKREHATVLGKPVQLRKRNELEIVREKAGGALT